MGWDTIWDSPGENHPWGYFFAFGERRQADAQHHRPTTLYGEHGAAGADGGRRGGADGHAHRRRQIGRAHV